MAALLLAAACGRDTELGLGDLPAVGRGPVASTALRIPVAGGLAQLYRVPSLDSSSWTAEDKLPPIQRQVGADPEQGLVFVLDKKRNLVALDLETRRVRTYLEQVRHAALGPDGAVYAVDTGGAVTQLVRRTPVRFRSKLQGAPDQLLGTMSGSLLARIGGTRSPALEVLGSDRPPATVLLPSGPIASTLWGDLVAVAADSAVVIYETQGERGQRSIPITGGARSVLFSPSGHRLYVARQDGSLVVLDRFSGTELQNIDLAGAARELRGDIYGQWILVRPEAGDSAWVINVATGRVAGTAPVEWDEDLPAVVAPNTLLTRRGKDVVALDLGDGGFPQTGRVEGGAADTWLALAWQPADDPGSIVEVDSALAKAADSAGADAGASVFLQVSSSQNPTWATELSQRLQTAGLPASVLAPKRSDEAYRVVLGPYATREQAEETGRRIGMPSFIVTSQDAPPR